MPKFTICTACTFNKDSPLNERQPRYEMFLRAANSVFGQVFTDFEWVIVDDISTPPIEEVLEKHDSWWKPKGMQVKVIRLPEKSGRIVARNVAMENATGEWITWLDADDEYSSIYLEAVDKATKVYPDYKMFSMNHLIFSHDFSVSTRKFLDMEKVGDRPFGSGTIGAGAFIFKKELFNEVGKMPEKGLWDLASWAFENYPEIKPFFWNEINKGYNSLGNPWGDDYLYFYMLTRKNKCKYLDTALYYVHSHYGEKWHDDPTYGDDEGKRPEWNREII